MEDLPKIVEVRRMEYPEEGYPKIFKFAARKDVVFYRPRIAVILPKEVPGGITWAAEACNNPPSNLGRKYLILGFLRLTDPFEQLKQAQAIIRHYELEDAHSRLTMVEEETLDLFNHEQSRLLDRLSFSKPPRCDEMGHICAHANLARELIRNKRVLFPEGCELQKLLADIPAADPDITDLNYPAEASALYLISALFYWPTHEPEPGGNSKQYDPMSKMEDLDFNSYFANFWERANKRR